MHLKNKCHFPFRQSLKIKEFLFKHETRKMPVIKCYKYIYFFCGLLKEFREFSGVCKTRCFSRQIHGQHPNKPEASNQQSQKAKQILACGQIGST